MNTLENMIEENMIEENMMEENMMMGDILYSRKEHERAALYYEKVTNIEPANS